MSQKTKHDTAKSAINNIRAVANGDEPGTIKGEPWKRTLRKRPGRTKYSNITLKRGYVDTHDGSSHLHGTVFPKVEISLMREGSGIQFLDAWPCKWKGWDLSIGGLQNAVQSESRKFQMLSNMQKARHDAMMATVRNMR